VNYDHAFHAGNPADVFKHAALVLMLRELIRRQDPIHYLDTHSGAGRFSLADKTGEWTQGIGRITSKNARRNLPELAPYLDLQPWKGDRLFEYLGSPILAREVLRPTDRIELIEKKPEDEERLAAVLGEKVDSRVTLLLGDGYEAIHRAKVDEGAKLFVHVDPPFEKVDEWDRIEAAFIRATTKRPSAAFMLWYPIKDGEPHEGRPEQLRQGLEAAKIRGVSVELTARGGMLAPRTNVPKVRGALQGSGLLFINAPDRGLGRLGSVLPELARYLARPEHGLGWEARWIGWG
jgi:23S rRNA (adenine2030-N6)-methyltransferase